MDTSYSRLPLHGIRILDFSWVLAGPYATRLMADFGAEVIKIQPLLPEADDAYSQAYYATWNRNKLGFSLDLSRAPGLEIARRLIQISDAVVENFSPRVLTNWGLDYAEMQKIKADIILLSLSMMGHDGPWRDFSGFGPAVQSFGGLTALTAYSENEPVGAGFSYSDHVAGLYGALALQGALEYRGRTGRGQYIDLSQTETLLSLLADPLIRQSRDGENTPIRGNRSDGCAPQGVFPCRGEDRWVAISVASDQEWQALTKVMGFPEEARQERFSSLSGRMKYEAEVEKLISVWSVQHSAEEAAEILQAHGIAAEAVKTSADLAVDPVLNERGFFIHLDQPGHGNAISEASPIRLSATPAQYRRAAPLKGQDNQYVLGELLGLTIEEIARLRNQKVIV
jgi:benzylsuccinate CoA-transferase BbsF subunit